MKCDQCGAENAEARQYCHSCGAVLVPSLPESVWYRLSSAFLVLLLALPAGGCGASVTGSAIADMIEGDKYSILPGFLIVSIPSLAIGILGIWIAIRVMKGP